MYRAVYDIQLRLKHLKSNGKNAANIAIKAKQDKIKNKNKRNNKNKNEQKNKITTKRK